MTATITQTPGWSDMGHNVHWYSPWLEIEADDSCDRSGRARQINALKRQWEKHNPSASLTLRERNYCETPGFLARSSFRYYVRHCDATFAGHACDNRPDHDLRWGGPVAHGCGYHVTQHPSWVIAGCKIRTDHPSLIQAIQRERAQLESGACNYSAAHQMAGVRAVTTIDCGPVGIVSACQACADFYAKMQVR